MDGARSAASKCQRVVALKQTTLRGAVHASDLVSRAKVESSHHETRCYLSVFLLVHLLVPEQTARRKYFVFNVLSTMHDSAPGHQKAWLTDIICFSTENCPTAREWDTFCLREPMKTLEDGILFWNHISST